MSGAAGEFGLRKLVHSILARSSSSDLDSLAREILCEIKYQDIDAALAQALPYVVQAESRVESPRPLRPTEAAVALGVHVDTVYALIKSGQMDAFRVGNRYRIEAAEVHRLRLDRVPVSRADRGIGVKPALPSESGRGLA